MTIENGRVRGKSSNLTATAAALVVVAVIAFLWQLHRQPGSALPVEQQATSSTALDLWPTVSPDGRTLAFVSDRDGAFEIYLKPLDGPGTTRRLTTDGAENVEPTWAPDGQSLAYVSLGRGGIWSIPIGGGEPRRLAASGAAPAFSPDGKSLVYQTELPYDFSATSIAAQPPSTLWIQPLDGGPGRALTGVGHPTGGHGSPRWIGDRIVFVAGDSASSSIWTMPAAGGLAEPLVTSSTYDFDPVVSMDGRTIYWCAATASFGETLWTAGFDAKNGRLVGEPHLLTAFGTGIGKNLALSPDGRGLYYSVVRTTSSLWSVAVSPADGRPAGGPSRLTTSQVRDSLPVFSPDGSRLAFIRWLPGKNPGDIWVMDAAGGSERRLTSSAGLETQPSWFPDGERIAFLSDRGGHSAIWETPAAGGNSTLLLDLGRTIDRVRLAPGGTRVAFHAPDANGALNVWVAAIDGSDVRQVTFDREAMGFPVWSPDGRELAVEAKRDENDELAVVAVDAPSPAEPIFLTEGAGRSWPHGWSPDGDRIAVAAVRDGAWEVRWVSRSTREEVRLVPTESRHGSVRYPTWSPAGDRVVYEAAETSGDVWTIAVGGGKE